MNVTLEFNLSAKVLLMDGVKITALKTTVNEGDGDEFAITYTSEEIGGAASFLYGQNEARRDRVFDEISEEKLTKMKAFLESMIEPAGE